MTKQEIRAFMIDEMVDVGELIPQDNDGELYEDMGGHTIHVSNLDSYITNYLENMPAAERRALLARLE